jgi:hypothetical protein
MKLTTLSVAVATMFVFAQAAEAREHHRYHGAHREARSNHYAHHYSSRGRHHSMPQEDYADSGQDSAYAAQSAYRGALGGRPSAWCGWEMRQLVGADPGPAFNLARNWAHWGRGGPAGVGAVVVWSHHVGKIVGEADGAWVIESGNDGHQVRTRPRSIAGAIAIRWG